MKLRSPAIAPSGNIPAKHTCDGADLSPPLRWTHPPSNTQSFALIVDGPDAPGGATVHWLLYGVTGLLRALPEGVPARDTVENIGIQGINGFGKVGYGGPCPPRGASHHCVFTLYALDAPVALPPRTTKADIVRALYGHVLEKAQLTGRYSRKESVEVPGGAGDKVIAVTDDAAIPSWPTALNNALYLIGELTNDTISTRILAEINLRFARIEEIIGAVRFNRQEEGWGIHNPHALELLDEHIAMLELLMAESRSRPEPLKRLEAAKAALRAHRRRIEGQ
jgi:Raf kinase inhibitor-like YbhB/YbcL family protein